VFPSFSLHGGSAKTGRFLHIFFTARCETSCVRDEDPEAAGNVVQPVLHAGSFRPHEVLCVRFSFVSSLYLSFVLFFLFRLLLCVTITKSYKVSTELKSFIINLQCIGFSFIGFFFLISSVPRF
jgi:hypothetical protein